MVSLPKPGIVVYRIDDYSDTEDSLNSPDNHVNEKAIRNGFSKIRSKLKSKSKTKDHSPTSSSSLDRLGRFRNLEISGPILQTSIDTKLNLLPVSFFY